MLPMEAIGQMPVDHMLRWRTVELQKASEEFPRI